MSVCIQDNKQEKIKTNGNFYHNKIQENGKDLIVLSEDEDDPKVTVPAPQVEKENVDQETFDNQIKFIHEIEKELKDEENALLLFKQLKSSQCVNPKAHTTPKVTNANSIPTTGTTLPVSNKVTNQQKPNTNTSAIQNQSKLPVMKVTKQVALNAIEQQFSAKRSALKKHLERAFENIPLPSPGVNSGLAEIAFVPSSIATDFSSLIGLEEVCKNIQEYETQTNKLETKKVFSPFSCARCQTDFTPVWKREKPGSTGVVCENCLVGTHKTNLHKDFEVGIRNAISQYTTAEKELQKEYDELVNNPDNLDKFIKEHEKKLTLAATQQAATPRTKNAYGNSNNNNNLIYSNGNGSANSLHNSQQAQALAVVTSLAAVANGNGNNLTSSLNAEVLQSLSPIQQAQIIAHLQAQAQQQQQQQQLVASLAAAAASAKSNSSNNSAALSSLASSLVNQQQQAHQIQQQQLLATVIATIQQQQQQQQQAAALHQNDQMSQLQSVLSLLGGQNNHRGLAVQSSQAQQQQNRQQQLLQQTLLQYSLLQQQQQQAAAQQVIVTQQSTNMKNSSLAATQQQQQQLALLQHILNQQQQQSSNNTSTTPSLSASSTPVVAASVAAATASLASSANNGNNANAAASLHLLQSLQSLGNAAITKK